MNLEDCYNEAKRKLCEDFRKILIESKDSVWSLDAFIEIVKRKRELLLCN